MEHLFDQKWEIIPAGGATGEAFFARSEEQKLFLKRNSSPFLAVLSAEGIVPKLVWTKRLENGDVISAQEWLSGRELKAKDMSSERVAKLLQKIHRSNPLQMMLRRLGKTPIDPKQIIQNLIKSLPNELSKQIFVKRILKELQETEPTIRYSHDGVCHGDMNHNNWLLTDDDMLYLIDWDNAQIGDPAIDVGMLLYTYVPRQDWDQWLLAYGITLTDGLARRMRWYVLAHGLAMVGWHASRGDEEQYERLKTQLMKWETINYSNGY
ncbi:phosphotransferase family protein [Bacillus fonticola]|uniref:phosphotransferase family protein n=1 Tax=Bacillus fonticola TaxID=2728853 RepID=UPI0014731EB9|nr:phosphotransferase family protein [Bacillus fonticola]